MPTISALWDDGPGEPERHRRAHQQPSRDPAAGTDAHRCGPGGPKRVRRSTWPTRTVDFSKIAAGFGVPSTIATTREELAEQFSAALAEQVRT